MGPSADLEVSEAVAAVDTTAPPPERRGGERRARKQSLHVPERRTGFDRRGNYPFSAYLRDNPLALVLLLFSVNALSGLDFLFTRAHLEAGVASESNLLLASMFAQNADLALLFKVSVMLAVTLGIWAARKHRAVLSVAMGSLLIYVVLIAYHIAGAAICG